MNALIVYLIKKKVVILVPPKILTANYITVPLISVYY